MTIEEAQALATELRTIMKRAAVLTTQLMADGWRVRAHLYPVAPQPRTPHGSAHEHLTIVKEQRL